MKTARQIFFVILFITVTGTVAFAQSHPILGKFSVSETEGRVFLSWSIMAGSTCNGIQIYRSTDSIVFSPIGEIAGVCGSVDFEQPYNFTDINPVKNKVNYYRLALGGQGFSQIVSIELIDLESSSYQIRPNPANSETKIYFLNNNKREYELSVFNLSGTKIQSAFSKDDFFILNTSALQAGLYVFTISFLGNKPSAQGKLLVQH